MAFKPYFNSFARKLQGGKEMTHSLERHAVRSSLLPYGKAYFHSALLMTKITSQFLCMFGEEYKMAVCLASCREFWKYLRWASSNTPLLLTKTLFYSSFPKKDVC
ncbi:hypothetical protein GOP47_0017228 [Adiantum capillus-veneris]|uniref:Uncharacterized protein n=1 Tax=Adiantum capillus-veneris TaxID=13818 RepID=A0A9D4UK48_ADICA|nr:hypothetical protein GOP47_0017228 [Adiantum capillus-veneris]